MANNEEIKPPESLKRKLVESTGSDTTLPPWITASSPPKFVTIEELMRTAAELDKMALAHEIALNKDFRLERSDGSAAGETNEEGDEQNNVSTSGSKTPVKTLNDLHKVVKSVVHKAFWESLESDFKETPPSYQHALVLLKEIKEILLSLLLPHHAKLKVDIEERLDLDLIEQQCENNCLDFIPTANYVLDVMSKLCAPVRDEAIQKLRQCTDVVPLYRGVFEVLGLMKLDMANFAISSIRPIIQRHSAEYEKKKFDEYLLVNPNGLHVTTKWLNKTALKLLSERNAADVSGGLSAKYAACSPGEQGAASSTSSSCCVKLNHDEVITEAAFDLLEWSDEDYACLPETFAVDANRLKTLRDAYLQLVIIVSSIITAVNFGGQSFAGAQLFKAQLKEKLLVVLKDATYQNLKSQLEIARELICSEFEKYADSIGCEHLKVDPSGTRHLLKSQISALEDGQNSLRKLIRDRSKSFVLSIFKAKSTNSIKIPPGLNIVDKELIHLAGSFFRIISHNIAVFKEHYDRILDEFLLSEKALNESKADVIESTCLQDKQE